MEDKNTKELALTSFDAVSKFKSVGRAYKRGHMSIFGAIYPRRPFNNRTSRKNSRPLNEFKKSVYILIKDGRRVTA